MDWSLDFGRDFALEIGPHGIRARNVFMQDDVEQRFVDANAAFVFDVTHSAKPVHEKADARTGRADHLGQRFLGDGRDEGLGLTGLAVVGHEKKYAGEAAFAGVEELIDEIGLNTNAAGEHELEEEIGERSLLMQDLKHVVAVDAHHDASGDGGCCSHAESSKACDGFFADEVSRGKEGHCGFFAGLGDDGKFSAAGVKIEDGVGAAALRKEGEFCFTLDELTAWSRGS